MKNPMSRNKILTTILMALVLTLVNGLSAQEFESVNVTNVARAETDIAIQRMYDLAEDYGKLFHLRTPTPIDMQTLVTAIGFRHNDGCRFA